MSLQLHFVALSAALALLSSSCEPAEPRIVAVDCAYTIEDDHGAFNACVKKVAVRAGDLSCPEVLVCGYQPGVDPQVAFRGVPWEPMRLEKDPMNKDYWITTSAIPALPMRYREHGECYVILGDRLYDPSAKFQMTPSMLAPPAKTPAAVPQRYYHVIDARLVADYTGSKEAWPPTFPPAGEAPKSRVVVLWTAAVVIVATAFFTEIGKAAFDWMRAKLWPGRGRDTE